MNERGRAFRSLVRLLALTGACWRSHGSGPRRSAGSAILGWGTLKCSSSPRTRSTRSRARWASAPFRMIAGRSRRPFGSSGPEHGLSSSNTSAARWRSSGEDSAYSTRCAASSKRIIWSESRSSSYGSKGSPPRSSRARNGESWSVLQPASREPGSKRRGCRVNLRSNLGGGAR